jgi:phage terminase large subunit
MKEGDAMSEPIQIKLDKSIFNEAFYPYLFDYSNRWEVYRGSAGSGKSLTFY